MHGFSGNKSGILPYAVGLHEDFNLVAIDQRNAGRSTGDETTAGVLEQDDLRAIIDWLEETKGPEHIGVLGNSLGAAGAITEARTDPRVEALALDSMHTRLVYQFEQRLSHNGHPAYPGVWGIFAGAWLRTGGLDLGDADPADALADLRGRPMLLTHGTADDEDLPYRTEAFAADAAAAGIPVELHWCEGAGHGQVDDVCPERVRALAPRFLQREPARLGLQRLRSRHSDTRACHARPSTMADMTTVMMTSRRTTSATRTASTRAMRIAICRCPGVSRRSRGWRTG